MVIKFLNWAQTSFGSYTPADNQPLQASNRQLLCLLGVQQHSTAQHQRCQARQAAESIAQL